ncbi:MAG: adenine-specific methyltransferase EcoRI family protein [Kiritimatiellae bacterium]|nr:adenine-specific methyltransferase EcoRI family protein [Kiritimatiellia bacterium]
MANRDLNAAKKAKNDEFYTQYADIEKEVNAYLEFDPDTFRGKTILLPCDDPEWSKFTRFFAENFERLGLRKLVSTSYAFDSKRLGGRDASAKRPKGGRAVGASLPFWQPTLFETEAPQYDAAKSSAHGKIFVLDHDANGSGRIDLDDLEWRYLEGDGDFRSDEVRRLRDEADVIVTNPPFSLFREFLAWIMEAGKQFLVIGNMNTINTKDVFPLVVSGKLWLGNGFTNGNAYFQVADGTKNSYADGVYDSTTNLVKFRNCCWYTNLEHGRRHQPLQLMSMSDNLRYSRHREIRDVGYRHYDNYDAIEVPYSDAIPSDYDGVMGVPVTFLDKFCPEQFEIVGITKTWFGAATKVYPEQVQIDANGVRKTVTKLNDGAVLKIDEPPKGSTWYEVGGERFIQTYPRILIRRRKTP